MFYDFNKNQKKIQQLLNEAYAVAHENADKLAALAIKESDASVSCPERRDQIKQHDFNCSQAVQMRRNCEMLMRLLPAISVMILPEQY